jgi:hypothetical protein
MEIDASLMGSPKLNLLEGDINAQNFRLLPALYEEDDAKTTTIIHHGLPPLNAPPVPSLNGFQRSMASRKWNDSYLGRVRLDGLCTNGTPSLSTPIRAP